MAGHQGLQRVVKTVKGKKGAVHRTYWVKSPGLAAHHASTPAGPHPSLHRANNAAIAGLFGAALGAGIHYAAGGSTSTVHHMALLGGAMGAIGGAMSPTGATGRRRNRK